MSNHVKNNCMSCKTGADGPSLWASADDRRTWYLLLCKKHRAKWDEEKSKLDVIGELLKDPKILEEVLEHAEKSKLTKREQRILERRFGLNSKEICHCCYCQSQRRY